MTATSHTQYGACSTDCYHSAQTCSSTHGMSEYQSTRVFSGVVLASFGSHIPVTYLSEDPIPVPHARLRRRSDKTRAIGGFDMVPWRAQSTFRTPILVNQLISPSQTRIS